MRTIKLLIALSLFSLFLTSCGDNLKEPKEPTVHIEYEGEDTQFFITKQNTVGSKKYSEYSYRIKYGEKVIYGSGSKEYIDSIIPIQKKKIIEVHNIEKELNEKYN